MGNFGKQFGEIQRTAFKNKKIIALVAISIFILAFASSFGLEITYSTGYQGPSAAFTTIGTQGSNVYGTSSSGSYKAVNPPDSTTWKWTYENTGTTFEFTPVDSTGNTHSSLVGSMGGIGFSHGKATQPTQTYSWNKTAIDVANRVQTTQIYQMALYPLTWSIDLETSTGNFQHSEGYTNIPVNVKISLNPGMWYFSTAPTNVYFGVAAIALTNYTASTETAGGQGLRTQVIPESLNTLLSLTSPANMSALYQSSGQPMSGDSVFYNYKGSLLNPKLFAPSVTTSIIISDLAPSVGQSWTGSYYGADANVHLGFTVDVLVVGEWTVKPTFSGDTSGMKSTVQYGVPDPLSAFLSGIENALLNNPLASFITLLVLAGVGVVILIVAFPAIAKSIDRAGARKVDSRGKKGNAK